MFKIENNHVILTEDSRYGKAGDDLGHLADVCVNHVAAIDPTAPADSLVYLVIRNCCDAHAAELAGLEAGHQGALESAQAAHQAALADAEAGYRAELERLEAAVERLRNPQPADAEAIEAAAQRRAQQILAADAVEKRALEIVGAG